MIHDNMNFSFPPFSGYYTSNIQLYHIHCRCCKRYIQYRERGEQLKTLELASVRPTRNFTSPFFTQQAVSEKFRCRKHFRIPTMSSPAMSSPAMSPPATLPRTLTRALSEHRNPPEAYATYAPYLCMTKRFLGEAPSFYPILSLSSPAIRTHVGLFARMFHAPQVDMCLPGMPSPALRRTAFITASRSFDCSYCTAHACSFGDMFSGSVPSQVRRGHEVDCGEKQLAEKAVEELAAAAVQRPETEGHRDALVPLMEAVEGKVGAKGLEVIKSVIAFSGALNTVMDVMGVELEADCQRFAVSQLKTETGEQWQVGEYHGNESEEASKDFDASSESTGLLGNLRDLMGTMPAAVSSMKFEAFTLYRDIPSRAAALKKWLADRIGDEGAKFLEAIVGTELKRAFCFGLHENLALLESSAGESVKRQWSLEQRLRFLHVFGTVTGSEHLRSCAVFATAKGSNRDLEEVRTKLEAYSAGDNDDSQLQPAENAARKLVEVSATAMDMITPEIIAELTSSCDPEACLELGSLVSFFELWRRMHLLFGSS